jgi:hypothetical protein
MDRTFDLHECQRSRVMVAVDIMAMALERGAPHMALAAAREAARSALLALAGAPCCLADADLEILKQTAAASPQHLAGRPTERQARIRTVLAILDRLFPRPPACVVRISVARPGSPASAPARGTERYGGATVVLGPGGRPERLEPSCRPLTQEGTRPWA